jgi:hypothetical protein
VWPARIIQAPETMARDIAACRCGSLLCDLNHAAGRRWSD